MENTYTICSPSSLSIYNLIENSAKLSGFEKSLAHRYYQRILFVIEKILIEHFMHSTGLTLNSDMADKMFGSRFRFIFKFLCAENVIIKQIIAKKTVYTLNPIYLNDLILLEYLEDELIIEKEKTKNDIMACFNYTKLVECINRRFFNIPYSDNDQTELHFMNYLNAVATSRAQADFSVVNKWIIFIKNLMEGNYDEIDKTDPEIFDFIENLPEIKVMLESKEFLFN